MGITLKHLDYFVATAEAGSIKIAAEQISISAPSISSAIAHLEDEDPRYRPLRPPEVELTVSAGDVS